MINKYLVTMLVILALIFSSCGGSDAETGLGDDFIRDMVSFDKAYIPALSTTSNEEEAQAKIAMQLLKDNWKGFNEKYRDANQDDPGWVPDFDKVGDAISTADKLVSEGELLEAHEELESIRRTMLVLRKRNDIDYFIDNLTEFHEPMEIIVLTAKDKTPDTFNEAEIETIAHFLPKLKEAWAKVVDAQFDAELFGFSDIKKGLFEENIQLESEAIQVLEYSIEDGYEYMIVESALGIKPVFAEIFMMFGDYRSLSAEPPIDKP